MMVRVMNGSYVESYGDGAIISTTRLGHHDGSGMWSSRMSMVLLFQQLDSGTMMVRVTNGSYVCLNKSS